MCQDTDSTDIDFGEVLHETINGNPFELDAEDEARADEISEEGDES